MSAINKSLGLSSSLEEEVMVIKKKGIVSILNYSNCEKTKNVGAASIRRTLSADMSSQKWQTQNGFNSSLKKIASSEEIFPISSSHVEEEEDDDRPGQFEIWNSIQQLNKENEKIPGQFDIWSSIVSNKNENKDDNVPPPYVHPLVKRSASLLSEKSLQICTESLGSETGSDGFSSYLGSETEDDQQPEEQEVEKEKEKESVKFELSDSDSAFPLEKYAKKTAPRSFPPPLASLSRGDGASLHMRPRRDNGRLVLEAVSVPSQNNFRAERQDGRLVLTFISNEQEEIKIKSNEEKNDDVSIFRVELNESEGEDDEEEEVRVSSATLGGGVMNVHRLALMMNKSVNRNPIWPNKFKNEEEMIASVAQSLPPRPPVGRIISMTQASAAVTALPVGSLNAYEYYWKAKPMVPTITSPLAQNPTISNNIKSNEKQELLVLRGNKGGNYLLPLSSKGCKEQRRSLLFWEPYCIAT